ncbi:hypothetical protein [Paulownia witches'-broom phytoplasma]|uniref:hypothetical protein n=1 Tax=Paulownia witches'-broom phytoplasma TaxID=39647 RepID=UPI0030D8B719
MIEHENLKEIKKTNQYFSGISDYEIEEQIIKNFNITLHDENFFIYDVQKNEIILKNIDTLLNQKNYFAKSYIKFKPGIYQYRDEIIMAFRYYFELKKINNSYKINIWTETS